MYLLEHTPNGEPGTRSQAMIAAQDNSRSAAIELNHLAQGNHPLQGTECRFSLLHSSSREEGGGGRRREEGGGGRRREEEGGKGRRREEEEEEGEIGEARGGIGERKGRE